jgi:hypothetical protein
MVKKNRHCRVGEQFKLLNAKLRGYYNYYGLRELERVLSAEGRLLRRFNSSVNESEILAAVAGADSPRAFRLPSETEWEYAARRTGPTDIRLAEARIRTRWRGTA